MAWGEPVAPSALSGIEGFFMKETPEVPPSYRKI